MRGPLLSGPLGSASVLDALLVRLRSVGKTESKTESKTAAKLATKDVTCTDGTTSKGGRGACSGHGGVKKADSKKKG